jgi:hypothetical protein
MAKQEKRKARVFYIKYLNRKEKKKTVFEVSGF